jgi:phosphatidylinositol kinase/protein kinase (PI-3  family)
MGALIRTVCTCMFTVDQVQEKFRLDLSDEEAIQYFQTLINDSVSALFPQVWCPCCSGHSIYVPAP